jgi:hypothetical protein
VTPSETFAMADLLKALLLFWLLAAAVYVAADIGLRLLGNRRSDGFRSR